MSREREMASSPGVGPRPVDVAPAAAPPDRPVPLPQLGPPGGLRRPVPRPPAAPSPDPGEPVDAGLDDAEMLELMRSVEQKHGVGQEVEAPARDPKGRFAPGGKDQETAKEQPVKAEEAEPGAQGERTTESARKEALAKARNALKRDGTPDDVLAATSEDTLLTWGEAARKRQAANDRAFQESRAKHSKKPEGAAQPETEAEAEESAQPAGAIPDVEAALRKFEEALDEDSGKALREVVQALRAQVEGEVSAMAEQLQVAQAYVQSMAIDRAQREVLTPYGEIDQKARDQVFAKANDLALEAPGTGTIEGFLRQAAEIVLGEPPDPAKARESQVFARASSNGARFGRAPAPEMSDEEQFVADARDLERQYGLR